MVLKLNTLEINFLYKVCRLGPYLCKDDQNVEIFYGGESIGANTKDFIFVAV